MGKQLNRDQLLITGRREKAFIGELMFSQYFDKMCNSFTGGQITEQLSQKSTSTVEHRSESKR